MRYVGTNASYEREGDRTIKCLQMLDFADSIQPTRERAIALWAKQAIENAIQRRNMTDNYELDVQISAQYTLKRRQRDWH
ncbi:hypothetical protein K9N68_15375 [Kovacikia minuta CCNUW1]|uniref:hypothetical protein n=1 Tax=Kovacikia minuta TaxID=2931930 RepID=UPI001CCA67DA|nr:hypothetical protein [Kovacikia minuta]UBF29091.1 hypothetical protein K9N68_15375 [Kovacikia minuta CCNUW1]